MYGLDRLREKVEFSKLLRERHTSGAKARADFAVFNVGVKTPTYQSCPNTEAPMKHASGREEGFRGRGQCGQSRGAAALRLGHWRRQQTGDLAQLGTGVADDGGNSIKTLGGIGGSERETRLRFALVIELGISQRLGLGRRAAMDLVKSLTSAGEGESLTMDEALDFKNQLNIAAAIKTLAGSALVGL
jgi:hypothetical protein